MSDRMTSLPVTLSVQICHRSIKLSDYLNWEPGTVISFEQSAKAPLTACVDQKPVGIGQPVKVGPKFGLRITKVGVN